MSTTKARRTSDVNPRDTENLKAQWKKQLTAYVQWMNSQLKKKPGAHQVEDLRHDIRDGVALLDLLEVIAGEKLANVHAAPSTYREMWANVEQVLFFMNQQKIKMHHITPREIVDGNLKSIMRLILALAAHYKPNSVRHSTQPSSTLCQRQTSVTGLAQGAAAALTEARRNANRAGHRYRRRRHKEDKADGSDSDLPSTPATSYLRTPMSVPGSHRRRVEGEGHTGHHRGHDRGQGGRAELEGASSSSSQNASPRTSLYVGDPPSSSDGLLLLNGVNLMTSCESDNNLTDSGIQDVCTSLQDTHQMLFQLHQLLLNGEQADESKSLPEGDEEELNQKEINSILRARLLHTEEVTQTLRSELNRYKQDCLELQGTKAGLQQRLIEQDVHLSGAKAKLLEMELEKEQVNSQLEVMRRQLTEREQVLSDVKLSYVKQVEEKDRIISDLRNKLLDANMSQWNGNVSVKGHGQRSPQRQGHRGSMGGDSPGGRGRSGTRTPQRPVSHSTAPPQGPTLPPPRGGTPNPPRGGPPNRQGRSQIPVPNSPRKCPSPNQSPGACPSSNMSPGVEVQTQVVYFTEDLDRPHNCVIKKKLGDIRLADLKAAVTSSLTGQTNGQTNGQIHYFFKALDPEYGTVKEELCNDGDILPGWEGKIVAWLEETKSTVC